MVNPIIIPDYDPVINQKISSILTQVVETIANVMDPLAIVLYGSFGRGEGSMVWVGDELVLLSDIEIAIVPKNVLDGRKVTKLRKTLTIPNIEITVSNFSPKRFNRICSSNWDFTNHQEISLEQYDLLSGMKVLLGDDLRNKNNSISPNMIQKWDALRLAFNRIAELLIVLCESMSPMDIDKAVNKLLMACGDSILILNNSYNHLCSIKIDQIKAMSDLVLSNNIDIDLILSAYAWKLKPIAYEVKPETIVQVLHNVLFPTLRLVAKLYFGWDFNELITFRSNYLSSKSLQECSRIYPGNPYIQTLLLSGRYIMAKKRVSIISWKKPHEIYANCVIELFDLASNENILSKTPINALGLSHLLDDWRSICYFA